MPPLEEKARLDEQASRAAGRIVDGGEGSGIDQLGNQLSHLFGGVKLACRLALPLSELSQKILVGPAQDIRLGVLQAQPVAAQDLNQRSQPVVVQRALAALPLIVVLDVQHALQIRIEPGDLPQGLGQKFAHPAVGPVIPDRLPVVFPWNVKANDRSAAGLQSVGQISLDDAPGQLFLPVLRDVSGKLVVKDIGEPLEEDEGQDEVLELGGIRRPPNGAGRIPQPGLQSRDVQVLFARSRKTALSLQQGSGSGGLLFCWSSSSCQLGCISWVG
jgi:hypothetical protein